MYNSDHDVTGRNARKKNNSDQIYTENLTMRGVGIGKPPELPYAINARSLIIVLDAKTGFAVKYINL